MTSLSGYNGNMNLHHFDGTLSVIIPASTIFLLFRGEPSGGPPGAPAAGCSLRSSHLLLALRLHLSHPRVVVTLLALRLHLGHLHLLVEIALLALRSNVKHHSGHAVRMRRRQQRTRGPRRRAMDIFWLPLSGVRRTIVVPGWPWCWASCQEHAAGGYGGCHGCQRGLGDLKDHLKVQGQVLVVVRELVPYDAGKAEVVQPAGAGLHWCLCLRRRPGLSAQ